MPDVNATATGEVMSDQYEEQNTDSSGQDSAYAASGSTLYAVDLGSGAATPLGRIGAGDDAVVSLTSAGNR